MERINPFSFYQLGKHLQELAAHEGEVTANAAFFNAVNAWDDIHQLLEGDPVPLGFSRSSAETVARQIEGLFGSSFVTKDEKGGITYQFPPGDATVADYKWNILRGAVGRFETVFGEEMREAATYHVPRRGIFYTPALVDGADETFPKGLGPHIPDKTRTDWCAAGRCLAFNLLSASGFHVARAVEGTLESYYNTYLGRPPEEGRSWGDYLADLEKVAQTPVPDEKTMAELRQMKDDYRNPLVHPRVVLKEADARMLFSNGESLIIAMAQEMKTVAESGVQASLTLVGGQSG